MTGPSGARQDPNEVEPVKIHDVSCKPDGGRGNRSGTITLSNSPGFATDVEPWIEARIVALDGSHIDSIVLGPGAEATREGFDNGTYKVQTYFDPDTEGSFDPSTADLVFVGEEKITVDCLGPFEFDLEFEPRPAVVGETVLIRAVPSREPDRGFDYYWDVDAANGGRSSREVTDEPQLKHVYDEPGEYEVELTVEFLDESELTVTETLIVEDPDASGEKEASNGDDAGFELLFEPSTPRTGEPVTCEVVPSNELEGNVAEYQWDINGDGNVDTTTTQGRLRWRYTEPGEWKLVVTAVLEDGSTVTRTQTVTVEEA
jgi:hypothetical protein